MSKYTFTAVMTADQDEKTGEIKVDHISKKQGNSVYFSDAFNLKCKSDLKDAINEVRETIFADVIDRHNADAPVGIEKKYIIGRPRLIPSMAFLKGQIVVPVEFHLEVPDDVEFNVNENGHVDALLAATVTEVRTLGSKMCNYPKPYSAWRDCAYGGKRAFFRKIEKLKRQARHRSPTTSMEEAFKKAEAKKAASG